MRVAVGRTAVRAAAVTGVLAVLTALAASAVAQPAALPDSLLDRLVGRWVLQGTIAGQATTHDVDAEWILGHEYVRLHEVSRERDAAGAPAYEAIVLIGQDPVADGYACLWLDSTGPGGLRGDALGHADRTADDSLPFVFRTGDEPPFHNTFRYDRASDSWTWALDAEGEDGTREPFARVTLTRR